jgi:CBS-domain-containing membrane protein
LRTGLKVKTKVITVNSETYVGEIMTRSVLSINQDAPLTDAIEAMSLDGLSVLPVVDSSGKLCGILSMSDLISLTYKFQADIAILPMVDNEIRKTLVKALNDESRDLNVSSAMTSTVQCVNPQDTVIDAARLMTDNAVHHLPVVNQLAEPIGMLSNSDIVRTVAYKPEGLLPHRK